MCHCFTTVMVTYPLTAHLRAPCWSATYKVSPSLLLHVQILLGPDLTAPDPSRAFAKRSMVTLGSSLAPGNSAVGGKNTTVSADNTQFECWLCQEQVEQACQGSEKLGFPSEVLMIHPRLTSSPLNRDYQIPAPRAPCCI